MIDKCPECGASLQATVPLYLSNVVLDNDGFVKQYEIAFEEDLFNNCIKAVMDCDPNDVQIYCENDHPFEL